MPLFILKKFGLHSYFMWECLFACSSIDMLSHGCTSIITWTFLNGVLYYIFLPCLNRPPKWSCWNWYWSVWSTQGFIAYISKLVQQPPFEMFRFEGKIGSSLSWGCCKGVACWYAYSTSTFLDGIYIYDI
jgi:hypothetical protein